MPTADEFNPYAAPKTSPDLLSVSNDQLIFDGETLRVPKKYTFPPICIKTGATTDLTPSRRRKFHWYPPLLALLILLNVVIFIIVALCVGKRSEVHFQLSSEVAAKRKNAILRNWGFLALTIVFGGFGLEMNHPYLVLGSVVMFLVTLILCSVTSRFLTAKRVDKTHIWIKGIPPHVAHQIIALNSSDLSPVEHRAHVQTPQAPKFDY